MYLLDTSVVSVLVDANAPAHAAAQQFLSETKAGDLFLCVVTLAELDFGYEMLKRRKQAVSAERLREVETRIAAARKIAELIEITRHIAKEHATLRAAYAYVVAPKAAEARSLKRKPPEMWHEDWPASSLQTTENDLWIAATALAHDFALVTRDTGFTKVQQAAPALKLRVLP
jgi:predicted nucleic acid-binding protein